MKRSMDEAAKQKRADTITGAVLVVLILSAFAIVVPAMFNVASGPLPARRGDPAPYFTAKTPKGDAIALEKSGQRVQLVDFWATWCPPCVASMPILERVYRDYRDKGFVVVGVDQEPGDEANVEHFLRSHEISFPIAMDPGAIAQAYGVYTFPTSFLIGKDGVIRDVHRGVADESNLRTQIEALLIQ
jgi:peroxiredoxin